MSSLSFCLKKMGLSAHEGAILLGATNKYMDKDRIAHQEAAIQAVEDYLNELEEEHQGILRQVKEQGGSVEEEESPYAYPDLAKATAVAKKLTKLGQRHKVIPHPSEKGKYAVEAVESKPPTEKQVAARAAAAERLRKANARRRAPNKYTDTLNEWIAKRGGMSMSEQSDTVGEGNKAYNATQWLFTNRGEKADELARRAWEEGFLSGEEYNDVDGGVSALKRKIAEEFGGQRKHYSNVHEEAERSAEDELLDEAARLGVSPDELVGDISDADLADENLPVSEDTQIISDLLASAFDIDNAAAERAAISIDNDADLIIELRRIVNGQGQAEGKAEALAAGKESRPAPQGGEPGLDVPFQPTPEYNVGEKVAPPAETDRKERADAAVADFALGQNVGGERQQAIEITPAMREKIMAGQALFQPKPVYNPDQLTIKFYDNVETRPGTTERQKTDGIAALNALFARDRRAGATILGSALWADYQERAGSELIGQQAGSASELALAAQILRDPRFETLRVFFTKNGKVVGHTGWTSRLPGSVAFAIDGLWVKKYAKTANRLRMALLKAQMAKLRADGYYLVHNHPSGRATPSVDDKLMSMNVALSMHGYLGHIIIDHGEYGVIDRIGVSKIWNIIPAKVNMAPELAHDILGLAVASPQDLVNAAKMLTDGRQGYATLISTNGAGNIQAIAEVPESSLLGGKDPLARGRAMLRIQKFMDQTGSAGGAFLVAQNPSRYDWLLANGSVTDIVDPAGGVTRASIGSVPIKRQVIHSSLRRPVLEARQMQFPQYQTAIGNTGAFDQNNQSVVAQDRPAYNIPSQRDFHASVSKAVSAIISEFASEDRALNRVLKLINTPYYIAHTVKDKNGERSFLPVYQEAEEAAMDVSRIANQAADIAPTILPRIQSLKDAFTLTAETNADLGAAAEAVTFGTLYGGGSPLNGRIFTDEELKTGKIIDQGRRKLTGKELASGMVKELAGTRNLTQQEKSSGEIVFPKLSKPSGLRPMTERQIKLYRNALDSVAFSTEELAKSVLWRLAQQQQLNLADGRMADMAAQAHRLATTKSVALEQLRDLAIARTQNADTNETRNTATRMAKRYADEITELAAFRDSVTKMHEKTQGLIDSGYFPLLRFGKYAVTVQKRDEKGNWHTPHFERFDSNSALAAAKQRLAKEYPGAQVIGDTINDSAYKLFGGINLDALEVFAEYMTDEQGNPIKDNPFMQQYFRMAVSERNAMQRQLRRKGTPGFSKDLSRALSQFTVSMAAASSRNYHAANMLRKAQNIKSGDLQEYATRYVKYLQDPQEEAPLVRSMLANWFILGNIASTAVNLTQPITMTAPALMPYISGGNRWTRAMTLLGKAATDMMTGRKSLTAEEHAAYTKAAQSGKVSPQEIHQIRAEGRAALIGDSPFWSAIEARTGMTNAPGKLAWRKLSFLWGSLYSMAEQTNRGTTFLAAYRLAKENPAISDPYTFAIDMVDKTQGVYDRYNRMELSRGAVGATIMTFKQFSVAYLELMKRLWVQDKGAFSAMALTLLTMAGVMGAPFSDDLEDLFDTLAQWAGYQGNSKKWLRKQAADLLGKDLANVVLYGISGIPGVPFDVQQRMGFQNLVPGSAMLKTSEPDKTRDIIELFGPAATIFKNVGSAITGLATGKPDETTKLLPVSLQNAMKGGQMLSTGVYEDMKGRKVMNTTPMDAVWKIVGFQPQKVAMESRIAMQNQQDVALHNVLEAAIADDIAHGMMNKEPDKVREAMEKMREWNKENPSMQIHISATQIAKRIRDMMATRAERMIKHTPKEMRQGVMQEMRQ